MLLNKIYEIFLRDIYISGIVIILYFINRSLHFFLLLTTLLSYAFVLCNDQKNPVIFKTEKPFRATSKMHKLQVYPSLNVFTCTPNRPLCVCVGACLSLCVFLKEYKKKVLFALFRHI